jgi:Flavin containing amine oxidoreductase
VSVEWLQDQTLDYHAYDWYHNPYTMGAFAHFTPGQFATFFPDIVHPAGYGRFHFAGEVASHHHAWIAGALDSARRVVDEIVRWDFRSSIPIFGSEYGRSLVFSDDEVAEAHFLRGLLSRELEKDGFD